MHNHSNFANPICFSAVADHLDREMGRLSGLETAATRAIEFLKERRAALVSAAITRPTTIGDGPEERSK